MSGQATNAKRQSLKELLGERIAVLDGSWGVLLQRRLRSEEDYRGDWFRDHSSDVGGEMSPGFIDVHNHYILVILKCKSYWDNPKQNSRSSS